MNIAVWIAIGAGVIFAYGPITQGGMRKINEKEFGRYVRRVGLPLPEGLRLPVLRRIAARERYAMITGAVVGLVGAMIAVVLHDESVSGVLIMFGIAFGGSLGGMIAVLRSRPTFGPDAPRVARSQSTQVGDYVSSGERIAMWLVPVVVGLGLLASIGLLGLLPRTPDVGSTMWLVVWICIGTALICWLGGLWLARTVVNSPQYARTDLELAWDDVCRTEAIRGIYINAVVFGLVAMAAAIVNTGMAVTDPAMRAGAELLTLRLGLIALAVGAVLFCALLVPCLAGWLRQGYPPLARLWPHANFDAEARSC